MFIERAIVDDFRWSCVLPELTLDGSVNYCCPMLFDFAAAAASCYVGCGYRLTVSAGFCSPVGWIRAVH